MNPADKQNLSDITLEDLEAILSGDPEELGVHLQLVDRDIVVEGHKVSVHCHCLTLDGNGQINPERLAELMRNSIADYAIPRSKIQDAGGKSARRNFQLYHSSHGVVSPSARNVHGPNQDW